MKLTRILAVSCTITISAWLPAEAEEIALKGIFSCVSDGQTYNIEDNHSYFAGKFDGIYWDETGDGPINGAALTCPGFNDVGRAAAGYCVLSDSAGDKAFITWSCKPMAVAPAGVLAGLDCAGEWTGGTGKFAGIRGSAPYQAYVPNVLPDGQVVGYAVWNYVVSLPD